MVMVSVFYKNVPRSRGHRASACTLDLGALFPGAFGLCYRHEVSLRTNARTEESHLATADVPFRFVAYSRLVSTYLSMLVARLEILERYVV